MASTSDRWDWTADASGSPARLDDLAAARYRRFRGAMEAGGKMDDTRFGLLLAVENARDELRPFEEAPLLVRLAGTSDELRQVQHLHGVLDAAVAQTPRVKDGEEEEAKWPDMLIEERRARVDWYRRWLEAGGFEVEVATESQQEEALMLLKAAVKAYAPGTATEILTPEEVEVMQLAFERVAHSTNVITLSTPDWLVSPLAVGSSFGLSRWGNQRLEPERDDPDPSARVMKAAAVWSELTHPRVVEFLGACHVGERPFVMHETVQPLVQNLKDRHELLKDWRELLHREFVWRLMHEIALALRYVHERGYAVARLAHDALSLAPFEDKALFGCMSLVPLEDSDSSPNVRVFATCIVDLWRDLDVHKQGQGALADRDGLRRLGKRGEFPVECPDFLMEREWQVLERMGNSEAKMMFREVVESLSELAKLISHKGAPVSSHPAAASTSSSW